jgi:hypothetical protein
MHKYSIAFLVLFQTYNFAQTSLGIHGVASFSGGNGITTYELNAGPSLHLNITKNIELAPALILGRNGITFDRDSKYITTQNSLGASFGVFWHLYTNRFLSFSLGPNFTGRHFFAPSVEAGGVDLGTNEYTKQSFTLDLPLNFDIPCSEKIKLRAAFTVATINATYSNGRGTALARLISLPAPTFGLLYTF